ncbi:hypothetical protein BDEG_23416 [Batrachochytrium dendrobatidis JEL423]|uniref:carbonic anhydrase n=1 Tax=Batrachochytrium dendrobatidis (strain JEL423) TaxID=403673 RepID=A0A177WHN8_BATDL|nr:hypothetical protein BDEG_23416 [Batrachochytrium dendrobatidis JEL423]
MFQIKIVLTLLLVGAFATANPQADAHNGHLYARNCLEDQIVKSEQHLFARDTQHAEFGYEGNLGPTFWAALDPSYTTCSTGKHQSPINFEDRSMLQNPPHKLTLKQSLNSLSVVNTGHTVQFNVPAGSGFSLLVGNQPNVPQNVYNLAQFHVHLPSEHHKGKRQYELEVHFVYTSPSGQLAVQGFWFTLSQTGSSSSFLASLLKSPLPKTTGSTVSIGSVDMSSLNAGLQSPRAKFWSYSGSLTTPPCTENVAWSVLDEPLLMSVGQYLKLKELVLYNSRITAPVGAPNMIPPGSFNAAGFSSTENHSGNSENEKRSGDSSKPEELNTQAKAMYSSQAGQVSSGALSRFARTTSNTLMPIGVALFFGAFFMI